MLPMPFSAIERVIDLMKMPGKDNSYGCSAVDPRASLTAIRFLAGLPDDLPMPFIIPEPSGLSMTMDFMGEDAVRIVVTPSGLFGVSGDRKEEGAEPVLRLLLESR